MTDKLARSVKLSGAYGTTNAFNISTSLGSDHSEEADTISKSASSISDVNKYQKSASTAIDETSSDTIQLEKNAGFVESGLTIHNNSNRTVKLKDVSFALVGFDPFQAGKPVILGNVLLGPVSGTSGTLPGLVQSPAQSALVSAELPVAPAAAGSYLKRLVLAEGLSTSFVQDVLRRGLIVRLELNNYTVVGQTGLSREEEMADIMARAARITVLEPSGETKDYYPVADGKTSLSDVLNAIGAKPVFDGNRLVSLFGKTSDFKAPSGKPELYVQKAHSGSWTVVSPAQIDSAVSPIIAGSTVYVGFVTNLDRLKDDPPAFNVKLNFDLPCSGTGTGVEFAITHIAPGAAVTGSFALWHREFTTTVSNGPFTGSRDPADGTQFAGTPFDFLKDPSFYTWAQAQATIMDHHEAQLNLVSWNKDISAKVLVGSARREAAISDLLTKGDWGSATSPDGTGVLHFAADPNLFASDQTMRFTLTAVAVQPKPTLGRTVNPPPFPSHYAAVRGLPNRWQAADFWQRDWPLQQYDIFPGLRGTINFKVVLPVEIDPKDDTVVIDGRSANSRGLEDLKKLAGLDENVDVANPAMTQPLPSSPQATQTCARYY